MQEEGIAVEARSKSANRGGLICEVYGIEAFLPSSHIPQASFAIYYIAACQTSAWSVRLTPALLIPAWQSATACWHCADAVSYGGLFAAVSIPGMNPAAS